MFKKQKFILLIFMILSFLKTFSQENNAPLISVEELIELEKSEIKYNLIDLRKPAEFKKGHILNAVNIWRTNIVDSTKEFGGYRVSKEEISALFTLLNIENEFKIIIYDAKGDVDAARLWWILKIYGFTNVSLLDGGITEWKNKGNDLNVSQVKRKGIPFEFSEDENIFLIANLQDLKNAINDTNIIILDTRTEDEFLGKIQKKGAFKKGRIPTSVLLDWAYCVDYNGDRKFKSIEELSKLFVEKGITKDKKIITYCQSGVRSAHTTFVLTELLGYKNVKNFDGSWIEWSYNDLPIETGEPFVKEKITEIKDNFYVVYYMLFGVFIIFLAFLFAMLKRKNT